MRGTGPCSSRSRAWRPRARRERRARTQSSREPGEPASEERSDREVNREERVVRRRIEREADVETKRPDRRVVAEPRPNREIEIAHGYVMRVERHLPEVKKDSASERLPNRPPELERAFDQAQPSERLVLCADRAEPAPVVSSNALFTSCI